MRACVIFHRLGPYHFARLRAAGRTMSVIALETSGADETYAWDRIEGADGFERVTVFAHSDAQKLPKADVASRIGAALDRIKPDAVAIPGWADAACLGALQWRCRSGVPAVVMSETTAWDEPRSAWREAVKRQVAGLFSAGLAGGAPHAEYLAQLGLPADSIFPGYDAVDNAHFAQGAESARRAEGASWGRLGLPQRCFLASARFIEKKNLAGLITAYSLYRRRVLERQSGAAPWSLVLLGDGVLRPALEAQIASLGLQESVQLPGFKQYPELPAYYGMAQAFVHASAVEPWGLVVNEAMASGLPVLVSNRCGCAQELVQDGVNGFAFDPFNAEELAQKMARLSELDAGALSAFGEASRRIVSQWGPERFASGLKFAVEKAVEVGPRAATPLRRLLLAGLIRR